MILEGLLTEIIFYNEDNGYIVGVLETSSDELYIVGYAHNMRPGSNFTLSGDWKTHPSYGEQFYFTGYEEKLPEDLDSIKKYLASGIIKGIGPKTAESIVNRFGDTSFDVISNHPDRLCEIAGIGPTKSKTISDSFNNHRMLMDITLFLQKYDINPSYALKLYKIYKENTIDAIRENPYRLTKDVSGIGFKRADALAEKIGFTKSSVHRIEAGIHYILSSFSNDGHTFVPVNTFLEKAHLLLNNSSDEISDVMTHLALQGELHIEKIEDRNVVFSMPYFTAETKVCHNLIRLLTTAPKPIQADYDELIRMASFELDITLANNQKQAIKETLKNSVCIITGGPGTGKTTTINSLIHIFSQYGLKIALAAPTGRAAKRITETSGHEAKTMHRLLEYAFSNDDSSMRFGKNEENTLDYDVIIIDEASMIDILLMNGLLKAVISGTRLIFVGDSDQLPSVGPGNVLRDMLSSELIPSVKLNIIFRQAEESLIVVNAHRINQGEYPDYNEKDKDFFFLRNNDELSTLETVKSLCSTRLPGYFQDCSPIRDIQVITPSRKGILGTYNLNKELQSLLNPQAPSKSQKIFNNKIFREGDKVMQIKNNYGLEWKREADFSDGQGVFNGDVGFIQKIDNEYGEILICFDDDRIVTYDYSQLDELDLAYAITVHKSQGSEFPIIVMPIAWFPPMLITRNLLYTAVTRGKQGVVLVGSEKYLYEMVRNNRIIQRYSSLDIRLKNFIKEGLIDY